jgi:hypothetical protein
MRMLHLRLAVASGLLLTGAACADSLLLPDASARAEMIPGGRPGYDELQGCVTDPDGVCLLPGIVVNPGAPPPDCNVWYSPSCGECMTGGSIASPDDLGISSACPGGGGTGPSPGSGGDPYGPGTGGSGGTPPPPPPCPDYDPDCENTAPADTCDTVEPVLNDPDVFGLFDELWAESVGQGVERGGWIVREGTGYRLIPFQNATFTPCGIDIHEPPPAGTISMVHTHPWPLWAPTPCGYVNTGTPSDEDVAALQQTGLSQGYFLDATAIGKFTATGGEGAYRIGRCGY